MEKLENITIKKQNHLLLTVVSVLVVLGVIFLIYDILFLLPSRQLNMDLESDTFVIKKIKLNYEDFDIEEDEKMRIEISEYEFNKEGLKIGNEKPFGE